MIAKPGRQMQGRGPVSAVAVVHESVHLQNEQLSEIGSAVQRAFCEKIDMVGVKYVKHTCTELPPTPGTVSRQSERSRWKRSSLQVSNACTATYQLNSNQSGVARSGAPTGCHLVAGKRSPVHFLHPPLF